MIRLDVKLNNSWEQKTALFVAYLSESGVQSSTVRSYISAIKNILKKDGYCWNEKEILLSSLTKACKLKNDKIKTRLPIEIKLLEMLLFEVGRMYKIQPYMEILFKTLFLLMYYRMMRVGEVAESPHTVKAANVHVGRNKEKILILLYSSKTHGKESGPQEIKIQSTNNSQSTKNSKETVKQFFCPFQVARQYVRMRGPYIREDEPFFILSDRSALQAQMIREILRTLLENLNLRPELYDTHSLRAGRSRQMAKFGFSVKEIRKAGRWRSNAVYSYLKSW